MDFDKLYQMSKEEQIERLEKLIEEETSKPVDEMDVSLIDECTLYILQLQGVPACDDEKTHLNNSEDVAQNENRKNTLYTVRKWGKLRKTILVACIMTLLLVASTFAISATGNGFLYQTIKNAIMDNFYTSEVGEKLTCPVYFTRDGVEREYINIYEFIENEKYETLLFPKSEKIKLEKIIASESMGVVNLSFITKECNTTFFTASNSNTYKAGNDVDFEEEILKNQIKLYTKTFGNNYLLVCVQDGWYYSVSTSDKAEGKEIISSLFS